MYNENNKSRRRGFFGSIIVGILGLLSLIGLCAMTLSVLNPYIDPQHFVWTSFFGLAFWEIFVFNLLVFFALLIVRSRSVWITILALVISIPGFSKSFSFGKKLADEGDFRVMTYNVHNFKHVDGKTDSETFEQKIIDKVKDQDPDVLCCQEFSSFKQGVSRPKCIELFAEHAGFPNVYYNLKRNYGGNVVFSKYPLKKVDEESGFGKENTYGIMVSVDADHGKVLHSIQNEINSLIKLSDGIGLSRNPVIRIHETTKFEIESVILRCNAFKESDRDF